MSVAEARKQIAFIERIAQRLQLPSQSQLPKQRIAPTVLDEQAPVLISGTPAVVKRIFLQNFSDGDDLTDGSGLVVESLTWTQGVSDAVLVKKVFAGAEIIGSGLGGSRYITITEDEE
jgi:hypothetical protein